MTSAKNGISLPMTVVIPVLDGGELIGHQLQSLVDQTHQEFDVLVIDNGSTDDTLSVVQSFQSDLRLRVLHEARLGRQHAINRALPDITGEGVLFLDADDSVSSSYVGEMATALATHDVVVGRLCVFDPGGHRDETGLQGPDLLMEGFGYLRFAPGASTGIRRAVLHELRGFDPEAYFCEDVDLSWRVQQAGYTIQPVEDAVVNYRLRTTFAATFRQHHRYGIARVWLYQRHRGAGMPRRSPREVVSDWLAICKAIPFLTDDRVRDRWVRRLARATGFVRGTCRFRTLYL